MTAIDGLAIMRSDHPKPPSHMISRPAMCIVAQGAKWATFGDNRLEYRAGQALVIGAAGLWRVGRSLGGYFEHDHQESPSTAINGRNLIGLGFAGGVVPCWDAVALLLLAAAVDRLAAGVALVIAFSAGMAIVLVVVGVVAMKLKRATVGMEPQGRLGRALALACGGMLTVIGCSLFFT